jgi:hypothetical protein
MAVFLEDVPDADHVHMRKAAGHLGFPDGPAAGHLLLGLGEVRRPDELFHGHVPFEQLVAAWQTPRARLSRVRCHRLRCPVRYP